MKYTFHYTFRLLDNGHRKSIRRNEKMYGVKKDEEEEKKGNGPKTELKFYYCFYFHFYLEHFHVSKHL